MFYLFVDRALEDVVSCSKRITLREHLKLTTRYFWKGFRICQFTAGSSPRTRSITILEHHVHGIDVCARYHQCIDRRWFTNQHWPRERHQSFVQTFYTLFGWLSLRGTIVCKDKIPGTDWWVGKLLYCYTRWLDLCSWVCVTCRIWVRVCDEETIPLHDYPINLVRPLSGKIHPVSCIHKTNPCA